MHHVFLIRGFVRSNGCCVKKSEQPLRSKTENRMRNMLKQGCRVKFILIRELSQFSMLRVLSYIAQLFSSLSYLVPSGMFIMYNLFKNAAQRMWCGACASSGLIFIFQIIIFHCFSFLSQIPCTMPHTFFYDGKFYFRLRQLTAILIWAQLCCDCQGEESPPKVVFHRSWSSTEGIFH